MQARRRSTQWARANRPTHSSAMQDDPGCRSSPRWKQGVLLPDEELPRDFDDSQGAASSGDQHCGRDSPPLPCSKRPRNQERRSELTDTDDAESGSDRLAPMQARLLEAELRHRIAITDPSLFAVIDLIAGALDSKATTKDVENMFTRYAPSGFKIPRDRIKRAAALYTLASQL